MYVDIVGSLKTVFFKGLIQDFYHDQIFQRKSPCDAWREDSTTQTLAFK